MEGCGGGPGDPLRHRCRTGGVGGKASGLGGLWCLRLTTPRCPAAPSPRGCLWRGWEEQVLLAGAGGGVPRHPDLPGVGQTKAPHSPFSRLRHSGPARRAPMDKPVFLQRLGWEGGAGRGTSLQASRPRGSRSAHSALCWWEQEVGHPSWGWVSRGSPTHPSQPQPTVTWVSPEQGWPQNCYFPFYS